MDGEEMLRYPSQSSDTEFVECVPLVYQSQPHDSLLTPAACQQLQLMAF